MGLIMRALRYTAVCVGTQVSNNIHIEYGMLLSMHWFQMNYFTIEVKGLDFSQTVSYISWYFYMLKVPITLAICVCI